MNAPRVAEEVGNLLFHASKGDVAGIQKLLDQGMPVDAADYDGRTALHLAASEGHSNVVNFLLTNKADVNPIDRNGDTPLANAKEYGHTEICKILADRRGFIKTHGLEEFEIPISELNLNQGKFIGKGAFGEIRVVKWRGTLVAAKTITAELSKDPQIVKEFVDELALLANLSHPNIVQFLGAVTTQRPMVMVTEYLPKGDLHDLMEKKGKLDPGTAICFALDIARGMNYLHQHKPNAIVHRDLKPRNLLQHDAGHLKVADFGLGKLLDPLSADCDALYEMTGETGSYRYMAPEVFMHKHYDKSVDVFSFAIIVQEMFEGANAQKYQLPKSVAIARAKDKHRPAFNSQSYPPGMKELIQECWDMDKSKRPPFSVVIQRLEKIQQQGGFVSSEVGQDKSGKKRSDKCTIM
ncbi:hypothetical protein M758_1G194000 [Ceratodon purpureus]|nr:hypothetical protein M758_1G194000 [Ceratodon purpureus]